MGLGFRRLVTFVLQHVWWSQELVLSEPGLGWIGRMGVVDGLWGYCGDGGGFGVVRSALLWPPGCPHPGPLPPNGRGDALLWERVVLRGRCCWAFEL